MKFSITLVLCIPLSALSFSRESISFRKQCRRKGSRIEISSQDLRDVLSDELIPQQETGLWLDLRQNAIHPKSAIEQLEAQIGSTSFVDRILLSETVFQNLIDFNDMYLTTCRILYQSSASDVIFSCSNQGLSTLFGNVLLAPSDATIPVEDPIQAIEQISSGKWLLLETNEGRIDDQVESLRINAVGNFLDIVSSNSNIWNSSSEPGGLVLPSTGAEDQESDTSNFGGVGVTCNSKSEVMKLASVLQMRQGGSLNSVTDSGIILQSSEASNSVATAVVLPFAIDLWQVATLVFGDECYDDYDDDESI
mmetsp:Transcript_20121/g.50066  ORF Transcript_20121/g.50066 Transcript_20121/m.50066 type:complete len:308 (+) Transcript_20121:54-977(+)